MTTLKDDNQDKISGDNTAPMVVVDLGKVSRKRIKSLKKGKGKLIGEVEAALQLATENMPSEKGVAPVVLIYERKPKRKNLFRLFSILS